MVRVVASTDIHSLWSKSVAVMLKLTKMQLHSLIIPEPELLSELWANWGNEQNRETRPTHLKSFHNEEASVG